MDYNVIRKKTKRIRVGNTFIGGDSGLTVQSMLNTDPHDFGASYAQAKELEKRGCDIVRLTFPDKECAAVVSALKESDISIPIVADIHFDWKAAVEAVYAGADKIRINPGNIGSCDRVKAVVDACREKNIPIRVGVNGGSLEKELLVKYGRPCAEALAQSALDNVRKIERCGYDNIVISAKSSDVNEMIAANRIISGSCDYPLHLGVTEAGRGESGIIKAACGLSALLSCGIGDTVRVSLTDDPVTEIDAAEKILRALDLYDGGYFNIISCPTCGRTRIKLMDICKELEERLKSLPKPSKRTDIAVMGCAVNGPGEARQADIGIAGGNGECLLFSKGEIKRKLYGEDIVGQLISEIEKTVR